MPQRRVKKEWSPTIPDPQRGNPKGEVSRKRGTRKIMEKKPGKFSFGICFLYRTLLRVGSDGFLDF